MTEKRSGFVKFAMAFGALILAEVVTLYAWSFLFLLEGETRRHGDPQLQLWAKVCCAAMVFEFLGFAGWLVCFLQEPRQCLPTESEPRV
jgi:hypothetical protein